MSCTAFTTDQYWNEFTEPHASVTTIKNGSTVSAPSYPGTNDGAGGWTRVANAGANTMTGYFTNTVMCNNTPGLLPGKWKTPLVWESYCPDWGVKRELSLMQLHSGAMGAHCDLFCNNLTDIGGNKRKPEVCGGTDANISVYNPAAVATDEAQGQIEELQTAAMGVADAAILESRKKIFGSALIIFLVIAVLYLFIF